MHLFGVSSYEITKALPKEVLEVLPTEEELNMYITAEDSEILTTEDGTPLALENGDLDN